MKSETKVRITSCSDSSLWYNARIGEVFNVIGVDFHETTAEVTFFWVRTGDEWNTSNWIHRKDAEYVT